MKSYREHLLEEIGSEANLLQLRNFLIQIRKQPKELKQPTYYLRKLYIRVNYWLSYWTTNGNKQYIIEYWRDENQRATGREQSN